MYAANRHRARANPRRHARRRYRRNPSFSMRGILGQAKTAAVGGLHIMAGRVGSRWIPDVTGLSGMIAASGIGSAPATALLALAQLAAGFVVSFGAGQFFGGQAAAYALAGAFDAVTEDVLQGFSLPVIGQYLGDSGSRLPMMTRMSLAGYSANAAVMAVRAPQAATARRAVALRGYSGGKEMVRRGGLGGGVNGYSHTLAVNL